MKRSETQQVERWFLRRGLSSLLEGTTMRRRRAARLARAMAVVFVLVMVFQVPAFAPNPVIGLLIAVGVVGLTWLGGNLIRRRPVLSFPERMSWLDYTVFLAFPPLVTLITPQEELNVDGEVISAGWIAIAAAVVVFVGQLVLLGVIQALAYSGLMALGPWLTRRMVASLVAGGAALGRTIPLLLGVTGFLFFTAELWQSIGRLPPVAYTFALLLFMAMSWIFLQTRALDLIDLARFERADELNDLVAGTPLEGGHVAVPAVCPLTKEQGRNLRLVMIVSKLTIAFVVSAGVFVFFVLLGLITVNPAVVAAWTQGTPRPLIEWSSTVHDYGLTVEHLQVCGFLAVFSGFYFAVVSATDPALREGLRDDVEDDIRQACAVRLVALQRYPEQPEHTADVTAAEPSRPGPGPG